MRNGSTREEVRGRGVGVVDECVIRVLVVGPNAFLEPHLLYPLAVLQSGLSSMFRRTLTLSSLVRGSTLCISMIIFIS